MATIDDIKEAVKNHNEGFCLDDYEFEWYAVSGRNTLVITPLKGAQIISMYVDNNDKLHAIVKEEPYKQYNPINITVFSDPLACLIFIVSIILHFNHFNYYNYNIEQSLIISKNRT